MSILFESSGEISVGNRRHMREALTLALARKNAQGGPLCCYPTSAPPPHWAIADKPRYEDASEEGKAAFSPEDLVSSQADHDANYADCPEDQQDNGDIAVGLADVSRRRGVIEFCWGDSMKQDDACIMRRR
jgi:hypothetical protein